MATTRGWALHGKIKNALDYILDLKHGQQKTNEGILVDWSGSHTYSPYSAGYSWDLQHRIAGCKSDIVGYHFQQSFPEGSITPEEALEISRKWIDEITGGKCDYVLAVHTNTKNIHTHAIVNPILPDGTLWQIYWKKDKIRFREASDRIVKEHGYEVLEKTAVNSRTYYEWMADKATSETDLIRTMIEYLCPKVRCYEEMKQVLEKMGFRIKDSAFEEGEVVNPNLFCCTVNKVLLDRYDENSEIACIRLPHTHTYVSIPSECFNWIKEGEMARVVIPVGTDLFVDGSKISIEEVKRYFQDKTEKGTAGLRLMVPGGKRYLKTKYIDGSSGEKLTRVQIESMITGERLDPIVQSFLSSKKYSQTNELRRELFSQAGVVMGVESCTSYLSQRQENYYRMLAKRCEERRNNLAYHKLMLDDRKHLPTLESRRRDLLNEIDEISSALHEAEEVVLEMEKEVMAETGDITQDQIEAYISKTLTPLKIQREQCRDLISMYTTSIDRVRQYEKSRDER